MVFACAIAPTVSAGSFVANPIKLTVPSGAFSTSLSLENPGDQPVLVQAEVMSWSQREGKDVLTPTREVVVSPPIFTLAAGGRQIVRVGLLSAPQSTLRESAYRLFLQEVAQPPKPGEQGISVALRLSLPLFVLPSGGAEAKPMLRTRAGDGHVHLVVENAGNVHVQTLAGRVSVDGKPLMEQHLGGYVLAGQTRSWSFPVRESVRGGRVRVVVETSAGEIVAEVQP